MRVILNLDESVLNKLAEKATSEKRSRKNYMELVLQANAEMDISTVSENKSASVSNDEKIPEWQKRLEEYKQKNKK